mmetsp:Transcript_207/g.351  ORF Transcript_207/g.351 Transcript_207/m.351 type:complete len:402 (-) Transcript_207:238-1443(-)
MKVAIITLLGTITTLSQNAYGQDEDFLPQSTPAPAAPATPMGAFDQCDNEQDIEAWTFRGGEAGRPTNLNFCATEYSGSATGGSGCLADSDCIETCFQDTFGYTVACSACFGAVPLCTVVEGCALVCMTDIQSAECLECNDPCIKVMNECTGLPQVSYCSDGREGVDDPSCTLALREETCEGGGLSEEACTDHGCCSWDSVVGSCNAACIIPEDGDACCATVAPPTASLTDKPTTLPTKAASDPTPTPNVRTPLPTLETFSIPTTIRTTPSPTSPNAGTPSPTNSKTIQTTSPPTPKTPVSPDTIEPTSSPTSKTSSSPNTSQTTPSPTPEPSSQVTDEPDTPEPTPQPTDSPSASPSAAPVPLPKAENSRGGSNENTASTSTAGSIAALVVMGLVSAVLA